MTLTIDVDNGAERLRAVIEAAAPWPDRMSHPAFTAHIPAADAANAWLARAVADPSGWDALRAELEASGRPLERALGAVRLVPDAEPPDWVNALVSFLRAQPLSPDTGAGALAASFRRAGHALLPHEDGRVRGVSVGDTGYADLIDTLARRLAAACDTALRWELRSIAADWSAAGLDANSSGWLARLEALPSLAYAVGVTCANWQSAYAELFDRLRADFGLLTEHLWGGRTPGPVIEVRGDAGDQHAGGRSVVLLTFAGGQGVAYKPKDLRHARAFMDLTAFVNRRRDAEPDLPCRTVLARGEEYGWEELVAQAACEEPAAFARFYHRLGMLMRLVQLLDGRDLWADNLIAAGEHPHLVDLECLVSPPLSAPAIMSAGQRAAFHALEGTVARTSMAAQPWTPSPELPLLDVGCLSRAGDLRRADGSPLLPLPQYRPVHAGRTADPWAYAPQVLAGYRAMHRILAGARDELAAPGGPLAGFADVWVRYIWRNTWDGYTILRAAQSPRALADGPAREAVLASLLRPVLALAADRADLVELTFAEIDAFRTLDIPVFRSRTTSRSVFTPDGREIAGHFRGTARDRLTERVAELSTFDLETHVAVLSGCVDVARAGAAVPALATSSRATLPTAGELLGEAVRIGDLLLDARIGANWITATWHPITGVRQVEVAGPDLVTGTGGIAVLLAELWAATGEPRLRVAALQTLAEAVDLVGPGTSYGRDRRLGAGAPVPGGLVGPGALVYCLARCAALLGEADLLIPARALVPAVAELAGIAHDGRRPRADLPAGTAGALLNLVKLREVGSHGHGPTDDAVARLATVVLGACDESKADDRSAYRAAAAGLDDLVPVGRDSMVLALTRVLEKAPDLLVDPAACRDRVTRHKFGDTRGSRLARVEHASSAHGATVNPPPMARLVTCRDLVATAGEALPAHQNTAEACVTELLARRAHCGHWYGDRAIHDRINLGALDGVSAIGLLLLRLTGNGVAPLTTLR